MENQDIMMTIHQIKEAALSSLEAIIEKQRFDVGIKRTRDQDEALVIAFQTLPGSPESLAVELVVSRVANCDPLKSGRSFRIRVKHAEELASAEPNDISLEITESQYVRFLTLCAKDHDSQFVLSLSAPQRRELDGVCALCSRAIEILRETKRRIAGCLVPSSSAQAAKECIKQGLEKVEEAHTALEQILTGTEPDEQMLEYYRRVVEDR